MNASIVFLLGAIGALAPEIIRLYSLRNNPDQFAWSWFYVVVSVVFGALGGVVALLLPATTYWGALYAGISTPVLISTALKKALDRPTAEFRSSRPTRREPSLFLSFLKAL